MDRTNPGVTIFQQGISYGAIRGETIRAVDSPVLVELKDLGRNPDLMYYIPRVDNMITRGWFRGFPTQEQLEKETVPDEYCKGYRIGLHYSINK